MSRRVEKVMERYTERDFLALKSIYDYRCLSMNQLYNMHYKQSEVRKRDVTKEYLRKKIIKFRKDGFVEDYQSMDKDVPSVLFLTPDGIKAVKTYCHFPENIYDSEKRINKRGYFTYAEVRVAPRFVPHQYNLNEFALNLDSLLIENNIEHTYVDERHVESTVGIRPDGIMSAMGIDIFLEMDMGTESFKQLKEKWDHYRTYLRSNDFMYNRNRVIVLFICKDRGRMEERLTLIKSSLNEHLIDCLDKKIEFYINTPENLLSICENLIVPYYTTNKNEKLSQLTSALRNHGFNTASGKQLQQHLNNVEYRYFTMNKEKGLKFLVQDFFGETMTAMNRLAFHPTISPYYLNAMKEDARLIIVGDSEKQFINNLKIFAPHNVKDVYFTTLKRLTNMPFNEALFIIGNNGTPYCPTSDFSSTQITKFID